MRMRPSPPAPPEVSHASIPAAVREARAFPEDLVRLSIGIEDPQDLIEDLSRAIGLAFPRAAAVTVPPRAGVTA